MNLQQRWAGLALSGIMALVVLAFCSTTTAFAASPSTPFHFLDFSWNPRHISLGHSSAILSSNHTVGNSSLTEAQRLIEAAQAESRERNSRLLASPRRNTYKLRAGGVRSSTGIQDNGVLITSTPDGTGVNATIGAALKTVSKTNTTRTAEAKKLHKRSSFWMESMQQNGASPFAPSGYKVWRNVKDYGAVGDGVNDDTDAINRAISDGNRCGQGCGSSTTLQAVVYFPAGTYLVKHSIVSYYFTQIIGDATNPPTIKVSSDFVGLGVISSDVYVDGGNGASWYINQNNFYRQVRNFVIDMTNGPPKDYIAGIHWQVAQATSLQNIKFKMSTAADNNQQGIFMENGSGGAMNDLEFTGGSLGAYVGNQQFTVHNLHFSGQSTRALEIHWDWGWTWKDVHIENTPIGVIFAGPDPNVLGSAIFIDSSFNNVETGFRLTAPGGSYGRTTLNLFNLDISGVGATVKYDSGRTLLDGGSQKIKAWGLGKRYDTRNGEASGVWQDGTHYTEFPTVLPELTDGSGKFFVRSKPQYESLSADQFVNLKSAYGAKGDGSSDDTQALNRALHETAVGGRILWIPAGVYLVQDTVLFPPGARVVGQSWSQIMGAGPKFSDANKPVPVVKVGNEGDSGMVEIQDLLFTVKGATAGAILVEWNIHEDHPGSAAMWDSHIRVGGAAGTGLQASDCPKLTGNLNPKCMAASMLVHITSKASAYFENNWFWVADHDLDIPDQTQIDVYVGRGVLVESTKPVWLYGTASEHCVLYQYQFLNAAKVFMGMIQTESPYYQTSPPAPQPFLPSKAATFPSDPSFDYCDAKSESCAFAWAVRILNSADMYIYGAGLYSWFQKYGQACVAAENCQDRIFEIESSSSIWIYSLITKASVEMISPRGGISVLGKDNKINFCSVVMAWMGSAQGDGAGGAIHRSPDSATVIPFPATTVQPTQTFTLVGPVVSQVDDTHNDGNQNLPPGPGADSCERCDFGRLITSTCCGVNGHISNPLQINGGVALPRPFILPPGFVPNQAVPGSGGKTYPAGQALPNEVIIPIGTIFPVDFPVPPGLPLSNTWSPDAQNNGTNGTIFLVPDFWDRDHTVSCNFPCTIIFPPLTTSISTWYPPPFTYQGDDDFITTTSIPPFTTQQIGISKYIVTKDPAEPTRLIKPTPKPKPLCLRKSAQLLKICPPPFFIAPPTPPSVVVIPVPPGGKPGPSPPGNQPTEEEQEEEDEEDEEDETCQIDLGSPNDDDYGDDGGDSYPGAGRDNQPANYTPPGAGVGTPTTTTATTTDNGWFDDTPETVTVTIIDDPWKYTSRDDMHGTIWGCESSVTSKWLDATVTNCAGSSGVVTTHPEAIPTPEPRKFVYYGRRDHVAECVDSHCQHYDDQYRGYAAAGGNPCEDGHQLESPAYNRDGINVDRAEDYMSFPNGICTLKDHVICQKIGPKHLECRNDKLELIAACTDIYDPHPMQLEKYVYKASFLDALEMHTVLIDPRMECESYDQALACY